jgi:hypothetical protein
MDPIFHSRGTEGGDHVLVLEQLVQTSGIRWPGGPEAVEEGHAKAVPARAQLRLEPLEQRNLLSVVLPPADPSPPRHGNELNSNVTAQVSTPAAVVGHHVIDPHGAVSVLAPKFKSLGGIKFGGGELSPQIQAGGPSSENVYGGNVILLGGGDLGVIIIAPDGVHEIGPWGPETQGGEQAAIRAGLVGQASRAARTIHPGDLAKAKAELSEELPAIRAAVLNGTGLTFTTRDLMISVLPGLDCGEATSPCQQTCGMTEPPPCDATEHPVDFGPWDRVINPAELSELQAVLKQAVVLNAAVSGGRH